MVRTTGTDGVTCWGRCSCRPRAHGWEAGWFSRFGGLSGVPTSRTIPQRHPGHRSTTGTDQTFRAASLRNATHGDKCLAARVAEGGVSVQWEVTQQHKRTHPVPRRMKGMLPSTAENQLMTRVAGTNLRIVSVTEMSSGQGGQIIYLLTPSPEDMFNREYLVTQQCHLSCAQEQCSPASTPHLAGEGSPWPEGGNRTESPAGGRRDGCGTSFRQNATEAGKGRELGSALPRRGRCTPGRSVRAGGR